MKTYGPLIGVVLATLFSALAQSTVCRAEPILWFCPHAPRLLPKPTRMARLRRREYRRLFAPGAAWQVAAAHINIFKIPGRWTLLGSPADLVRQFAFLKRRHIALALEFGVLNAPGRAGKVEGFVGASLLSAARRIQHYGGALEYLAMDEPIFFGSIYGGRFATHWRPRHVVANAAKYLGALRTVYPGVKIGDIEPLGGSPRGIKLEIQQYRQGVAAFRRAGIPLAFFHADVNWPCLPPGALLALRQMTHSEHVPFGVICDGQADAAGNTAWLRAAERHLARAQAAAGTPDQIVFQSWNPYPLKLLPETAPNSFTHLIDAYVNARTILTASLSGSTLSGQLTGAAGRPIAGAPIKVEIHPFAGKGVLGTLLTTGRIPQDVKTFRFGISANRAGGNILAGPVDVWVRQFRLQTADGWCVVRAFGKAADMRFWPLLLGPQAKSIAVRQGDLLHLTGQRVQFVSRPMFVPRIARGKAFTFSVQARIAPASVDSGYFFSVFPARFGLHPIFFRPAPKQAGTAVTAGDGAWSIKFRQPIEPGWAVVARYGGDRTHWPAYQTLEVTSVAAPCHEAGIVANYQKEPP